MENMVDNADAGTLKSTRVLGVERITTESLKQGAQEQLESYYEKRDRLAEQIATFEEALASAREELKLLNKNNKKLLKQTGYYKTQDEHIYYLIKNNPGLLDDELFYKVKENNIMSYVTVGHLHVLIANMSENITKIDGRYFINKEYKKPTNSGLTNIVKKSLKDRPKTRKEIIEFAQTQNYIVLSSTLGGIINNLVTRGKIVSNRTHKSQKNVTYTWIGE